MGRPRKYPNPAKDSRFGEWTVVDEESIYDEQGCIYVLCRCSCGRECEIRVRNLYLGTSTGCRPCKDMYIAVIEDRDLRVKMLTRIRDIIGRCYDINDPSFKDYGARGITVYSEWLNDRREFLKYLITLPGWDNPSLELDRENNNGNYEPGNLRFITHSENCSNTRRAAKYR